MTITECYDFAELLREAEATLQISGTDYEEADVDRVVMNVRQRISRQHQIDITARKMNDPEIAIGLYQKHALLFVSSAAMLHSKLCGLAQTQRFITASPLSLSKLNWLGYAAQSMKAFLTVLQREATLPSAVDAINSIKEKLPTIGNCMEKRLFMVLVVADAIGFPEIVAAIAEILYQATL